MLEDTRYVVVKTFGNWFLLYQLLDCCSEEIGKSKFNSMIGLADHQRIDQELYDDYESAKAREVYSPVIMKYCYV